MGWPFQSDPLPSLSFVILNSADVAILTCDFWAEIINTRGWDWMHLCRIEVRYV
jgi:hypothetical protein